VTAVPGTAVAWPSVLVTARSAVGVSVSVSVALLLARLGSVKPAGAPRVAVFTRVPVAVGLIVPVALMVAVPPGSSVTTAETAPGPPEGAQAEPADGAQLQVTPAMAAGKESVTVPPVTVLGPGLVATIV